MNTDVMIDIESLSTKPNAVVLSVGAVAFNCRVNEEKNREYFHEIIGTKEIWQEQVMFGRHKCKDTVAWWKKQLPKAKEIFKTASCESTYEMLEKLSKFIKRQHPNADIWSNGANFDGVILRSLYETYGLECPWKYHQEQCFRTYKRHMALVQDNWEFEGVQHNALADAKHQTKILVDLVRKKIDLEWRK